jgi:hypothetical protein
MENQNPQNAYYETMNTVLTPVQFVIDGVKGVLFLVLVVTLGLIYPIIQLCNGEPLSLASILVPTFTVLAIFTFFYAPLYTVFGGIISIVIAAAEGDFIIKNMSKEGDVSLLFAFLIVGILQRYIRHRLFDPPKEPKPKRLSIQEQFNQANLEVCTHQYDTMDRDVRGYMIERYGHDYLKWPRPWPSRL